MQKYRFKRRGREGYAEDAEKKYKIWLFLFCDLCVTFAPSAFKNVFSLNQKGAA